MQASPMGTVQREGIGFTCVATEAERQRNIEYHWVVCPACGNLVSMQKSDVHATETLRSECQGPLHCGSD